jgi:hypothetical protein
LYSKAFPELVDVVDIEVAVVLVVNAVLVELDLFI